MNYLEKAYRVLNIKYHDLKVINAFISVMAIVFLITTILLVFKVDYYKNENNKSINSCKNIIRELIESEISISQV